VGIGVTALLTAALLTGCGKPEPEGRAPASAPATQKAEPAKGLAQPDEERAQIAQTVCPVTGGNINPNIYVDHNGRRIYFCCDGCDDAFQKHPAKYLERLDKQLRPAREGAEARSRR